MTHAAVIYALGAGRGHAQRAASVTRRFSHSVVFHQVRERVSAAGIARWVCVDNAWTSERLRATLLKQAASTPTLVVDTFPSGLAGELDSALLDCFQRTILIRRYLRPGSYPHYDEACSRFSEQWLPYQLDSDEWEGEVQGRFVGSLTRPLKLSQSARAELVVIGEADRIANSWLDCLPENTNWVCGSFQSLPRARRYISVGAGHNICYELSALGVHAGFFAFERRYDDQFRRADRVGVGLHTRNDLCRFLET